MSILVLDVGTTSMRGILYDYAGAKCSVCQVQNHPVFEPGGIVYESPDDWENNTETIMRTIAADAATDLTKLEAIAITSQRSSILPLDHDGRPLLDTIMWQDTRNRSICDELAVHNTECFEKTGARVNTVFSGSKMTWVRRKRPDIYAKTARFVNIPEYINYLMSGEFCSDYTYASRSGLMNLYERSWDPQLLSLYEVDAARLNRLIEPGQICGRVTEAFSSRTGIPEGTPIIHAGGDQQCAAVGLGVTKPGNVSVVLGTGGFLITACDRIPNGLKSDVICNCASVAGKYVIEANVLAMSAAYDWFIREFYGMKEIDYAYIEEELSRYSGVTEPLVIPYLKGRGVPDWNASAKAVFADVTLSTTRSELFRALMESLFMELANQLDTFRRYTELNTVMASGGLTKSKSLLRLLTDVLGLPVKVGDDAESTAWGAYLVARTGLGHYADIDEAYRVLTKRTTRMYEPDPLLHEAYEEKRARMNTYYLKNAAV